MTRYLIVNEISEEKEDKNNRIYKTIIFKTPDHEYIKDNKETIKVSVKPVYASLNVWKDSYVSDGADYGYYLEKGEKVMADIVTESVESYKINDGSITPFMATTFTCVVFGDSSKVNWREKVEREFKRHDKKIKPLPTLEILLGKNG